MTTWLKFNGGANLVSRLRFIFNLHRSNGGGLWRWIFSKSTLEHYSYARGGIINDHVCAFSIIQYRGNCNVIYFCIIYMVMTLKFASEEIFFIVFYPQRVKFKTQIPTDHLDIFIHNWPELDEAFLEFHSWIRDLYIFFPLSPMNINLISSLNVLVISDSSLHRTASCYSF